MARLTLTLSTASGPIAVVHMDVDSQDGGRSAKVTVERDNTKSPTPLAALEVREKQSGNTWQLVRRVADALAMSCEVGGAAEKV